LPNQQLKSLLVRKRRSNLQKLAQELVKTISNASNVSIEDFGVHGSIALNTETAQSDIDLTVYGAQNFRRVKSTVRELSQEGVLQYAFNDKLDKIKNQHGRFKGRRFIYNAVRKFEEITTQYGDNQYSVIEPIRFKCTIIDDDEAMFRPAVYRINGYLPLNEQSRLERGNQPSIVTSMIGAYRNVARKGDLVEVSGVLERVESVKTGKDVFQVVIGSGTSDSEFVMPSARSGIERNW
jgi:predicted nucleotidyltransferase